MFLLILFLLLALGVSFVCSLLESMILSVSQAYIALLISEEHHSGQLLKRLKQNIDHPLAAILTLNTVANTIGAAGVGAQTYSLFGSRWVAVSSASLTVLILVCSEIIPKTLGAAHWKRIAPYGAYVLRGMIFILYPIVLILEGISKRFYHEGGSVLITRDEMVALAEIGQSEGILLDKEAKIIRNLFLLNTIKTADILTPRSVMFAIQEESTVADIIEGHVRIAFSRIPVFGETRDDIKGFVLKNDLVESYYGGKRFVAVSSLMNPLHAVPEAKTIAGLLDEFLVRREHMFLVVDEYGGTAGIVTLEDAIETLLGVEIVDEADSIEDMRAYALDAWKKRRKTDH